MDAEIKTLETLTAASEKCFTLALRDAYLEVPHDHIISLLKKGYWYVLSATQGNITEAGMKALRDAWEQDNHQAVVSALIEDARAQGLVVEMVGTLAGEGEAFRVTSPKSGVTLTMGRAELALFTVEARLCKAGVIR